MKEAETPCIEEPFNRRPEALSHLKGIKGMESSFILAQKRSQEALVEQVISTTHFYAALEMLSVVVVALALSVLQPPFSESFEL